MGDTSRRGFIAAAGALTAELWSRPASAREQAQRRLTRAIAGASAAPCRRPGSAPPRTQPWRQVSIGPREGRAQGRSGPARHAACPSRLTSRSKASAPLQRAGLVGFGLSKPGPRQPPARAVRAGRRAPSFTLCRMPVGANDFSRDWYSYDEAHGDFALEHFSIANDLETLVPFIKAAQEHQPALRSGPRPGARPPG